MRRSILAAVLALLCTLAMPQHAHTQEKEGQQMKVLPQAELDIIKVLLAQDREWNSGSISGYAAGYKNAPDTVFLGSEVYRGFDQMLERYRRNYPDRATMGTLSFSDLEPRLLGENYACLTGHFTLERDKKHGGQVSGEFSLVLEKTKEGWKIILDHTT